MKIAAFHSGLDIRRGSSLAFLEILKVIKGLGNEVHVHSFNINDWFRTQFTEASIPVNSIDFHPATPFGVNMILTNNRRARRAFGGLLDTFGSMDAAYLHGNLWTPHFLPMLRMPTVYYCDEPPRHYYEPDLVNTKLSKRVGKTLGSISRRIDKAADRKAVVTAVRIVTNSNYTRSYIKDVYGVKATAIYSGVDHERFCPDDGVAKEDMVASIGALYPLKGHDLIIRSLGTIDPAKRPRLIIVGKGDQGADLTSLARREGVTMEILTEIDHSQLIDIYRRAKLTLIAHIGEPFGLVAVESMSCGTPVVAVGEAGLLETVTDETGILTSRKAGSFATAVSRILDDDEQRRSMGRLGREWVKETFDWNNTGAQILNELGTAVRDYNEGGP